MILPAVNVKYCNRNYTEPPYKVERHIHTYWELVYYGGLGISEVNGISFNYIPGSYVIIPSRVPHSEKALFGGALYVIGFDTEMDDTPLPNQIFFDTQEKSIQMIMDMIVTEVERELPYCSQRVNLLMQDIILQTMRQGSPQTEKTDHKLEMMINYIDAYYTMDINLEMLANSLAYSPDYLRHYFKEKKKISLKQYIINKRIALAKELLTTDLSIIETAKRCGFSSPSYFSTIFRQTVGIVPTQYHDRYHQIVPGNETILYDPPKENSKQELNDREKA